MWSTYNHTPLTDGCWSPSRPAVFYTTSMTGILNVWDILFKQDSPTLTLQVENSKLTPAML